VSPFQWFVAALCSWILRERDDLIAFLREENRVLQGQLRGRRLRLSDEDRRRVAVLGHQLGRAALAQVATIATADTILRWHRALTARSCAEARRRSGRPRVEASARSLIGRMATENATWGYTRIQGALKNLGHRVGRSTIARILREQDIPPSGQRPMAWRTCVRAHWPALLASDLIRSVAGTLRRLITHQKVLLTERQTRRMAVLLAVAPGQRPSASGHCSVDEQVHGVLAITQPDALGGRRGALG
jgi:putative transposase